ncbi:hypothetical protein KI688_005265 [Linnemannia hyalina]|uniref:HAT C-terminal dimerisation domain-containing protein n=1 Tax=Linnemannia hyalina TaxID=64524 RepID=A0A9P8BNL2_9FUNG|nr:hypothetical protein KI688_005265 [Linnemannia hyalina]
MNETRWNSRYEMIKRVIKLGHYINTIINRFTANPAQLPAHIKLDELKSYALSVMEVDSLQDIELILEKASGYGNNMGASTISTISKMYLEASIRLSYFTKMKTYLAEMEIVRITTQQQNTLLAAIYFDPNLLDDKIWKGVSDTSLKERAMEAIIKELIKDYKTAVTRRFLRIQSTSCKAERVFSKAGYLTLNRKSGLSTPNLHHILFSSSITTALTELQKEIEEAKSISTAT